MGVTTRNRFFRPILARIKNWLPYDKIAANPGFIKTCCTVVTTAAIVLFIVGVVTECSCNYESFIRYRLAKSEVIFRKAVKARHLALKETPIPDDNPWSFTDNRMFWDYFYPNFNCPHDMERVGRVGDGGKWVCGLLHLSKRSDNCIVYSYGVNADTSFEEDILNRTNCVIRAFDNTIELESVAEVVEKYKPRLNFSQTGLGKANTRNLRTLRKDMQRNGDSFIDILKVDIESAEFETLAQILKDFPDGLPFGQLLIEIHLHLLPLQERFQHFLAWWEKLEKAGLRAVYDEPNLLVLLFTNVNHASWMEFTFLNVKSDHVLLHG